MISVNTNISYEVYCSECRSSWTSWADKDIMIRYMLEHIKECHANLFTGLVLQAKKDVIDLIGKDWNQISPNGQNIYITGSLKKYLKI